MQNQLKDAAKPQATTSTATPPAPVTSHAESGQQSTAETPEILAAKPLSDKATSDNPVVMELLISEITIDEGMQCRHEISKEAVRDYAEMIQAGDNFPPVTVFDIEGKKVLADGFHRYHAAKKSGRRTIKVAILNGSRNDALLFGIKANSQHGGLRFTNRDKKHAVCIVLRTFPKYSNGMVADLCRVSAPFVSKMRGVLESGKQPETVSSCLQRVGRDGKRRKLPSKKANAPETTASESSTYADVEKCETKPASIIANAAPDGKSDEADERANPVELDRPPVFDRELTPFAHIQRTIRTAWQQLPASDRPEFLKKSLPSCRSWRVNCHSNRPPPLLIRWYQAPKIRRQRRPARSLTWLPLRLQQPYSLPLRRLSRNRLKLHAVQQQPKRRWHPLNTHGSNSTMSR